MQMSVLKFPQRCQVKPVRAGQVLLIREAEGGEDQLESVPLNGQPILNSTHYTGHQVMLLPLPLTRGGGAWTLIAKENMS